MRILIVGWAKSGTTVMYEKIRAAMPADTQLAFEPKGLDIYPDDRPLLVKKLIGAYKFDPEGDYVAQFDKILWMRRDPRDFLISMFLFSWKHRFEESDALEAALNWLRQKQAEPRQFPVWSAFESPIIGVQSTRLWHLRDRTNSAARLIEQLGDRCRVAPYEKMVRGEVADLSAYLGLDLAAETQLSGRLGHVSRSRRAENWRSWFTPQDVTYYRDALAAPLERLGYDPEDWRLEENPEISARESFDYVAHIVSPEGRAARD